MEHNIIERKSLGEEVADKLRQQITKGIYKTGDKLPTEPELMKLFGVGRSSAREAVKLLVNAGMLKVQQGSGTFVQEPVAIQESFSQRLKRSNYKDLDEVRQLLEVKIAEKAAVHRTDADIVAMKQFLDMRNKGAIAGNLNESIKGDVHFHMAIADASGNEILADLYKSVAIQLKTWFLQVFTDTTEFQKTAPLHQAIYDSIVAGDVKQVKAVASKLHGRFL